jgi:hypothetical protein
MVAVLRTPGAWACHLLVGTADVAASHKQTWCQVARLVCAGDPACWRALQQHNEEVLR